MQHGYLKNKQTNPQPPKLLNEKKAITQLLYQTMPSIYLVGGWNKILVDQWLCAGDQAAA